MIVWTRSRFSLTVAAVAVLVAGCAPSATFGSYAAFAERECEEAVMDIRGTDGSIYVGGASGHASPVTVDGSWASSTPGAETESWTCRVTGSQATVTFGEAARPASDPASTPRIVGQEPSAPDPDPAPCLIKGNVSSSTGERIYHVPGQAYYDETVINSDFGERWFCTEDEAVAAGWRKSYE